MQDSGRENEGVSQISNSVESLALSTAQAVFSTQKEGSVLPAIPNPSMAQLSDEDEEDFVMVDHLDLVEKDLDDCVVIDNDDKVLPYLYPETLDSLKALLAAAGINGDVDEAAAVLIRLRLGSARSMLRSSTSKISQAEVGQEDFAVRVKELLKRGLSWNDQGGKGDSFLSLASEVGYYYYEVARLLLEMGADVEERGIKGDLTPLMVAARAGHIEIVIILFYHGADVHAQSSSGNTPLMYACQGGNTKVLRRILHQGADIQFSNRDGCTPLMEAAGAGHVDVAKILLHTGAYINHTSKFMGSALNLACNKGHLEMVRLLLEAGADMEIESKNSFTPLMEACDSGLVEVARLLLDYGAKLNASTDRCKSPLSLAVVGGHLELVMLLLERGANPEEANDAGYTPLMVAASDGREEMVALLLSQGAELNALSRKTKETALTLACRNGCYKLAKFLIQAGANVELGGKTPLMEAARNGRLELVCYLLDQADANIHACTPTRDTALIFACENGCIDVVQVLLEAGANVEHSSEGGITPLMKAVQGGHVSTAQLLIKFFAKVNQQTTNNDHTPLSLACASGHLALVELLLSNGADPTHRLKDNSTMLIEASKGGHTAVVKCLLDYLYKLRGRIPLVSANARKPCFVLTNTVATQYVDPSLPTSALTEPIPATSADTSSTLQDQDKNCLLINVIHQTDSNHGTALTLACAGGHEELVKLLLARGAKIGMEFDHRDKKGYTPLLLAAAAGHAGIVEILLDNGADIEESFEQTKDTPLSLACSKGHYEVVKILLSRGANKEHHNVSCYTSLNGSGDAECNRILSTMLN